MTGPLGGVIERLRRRWPELQVLIRADSAYAREELLAWCEDSGVDYAIRSRTDFSARPSGVARRRASRFPSIPAALWR